MTSMGIPYVCLSCRRELSLRLSRHINASCNARCLSSISSYSRRNAISRPTSLDGYRLWDPRQKATGRHNGGHEGVFAGSEARHIPSSNTLSRLRHDIFRITRNPDEAPIPRPRSRPSPARLKHALIPKPAHPFQLQLESDDAHRSRDDNPGERSSHTEAFQKRRRKASIAKTADKDMSNRPSGARQLAASQPDTLERPNMSFMQADTSSKHFSVNSDGSASTFSPSISSPLPDPEPLRSVEDEFILRILEGRTDFTGPYSRPRKPKHDADFPRSNVPLVDESQAYSFFLGVNLLSPDQDYFPAGELLYSSLLPRTNVNYDGDRKRFSFQSTPVRTQSSEARLADHADEAPTLPAMTKPPAERQDTSGSFGTTTVVQNPRPHSAMHSPNNPHDTNVTIAKSVASSGPAVTRDHAANNQMRRPTPDELQQEVRQLFFSIRQQKLSPEKSWNAFLIVLRKNGLQALKDRKSVLSILSSKIVKAWCYGSSEGLILTPAAVLRRFSKLGIEVHHHDFEYILRVLLNTTMDQIRGVQQLQPTPPLVEIVTEIVNIWNWWLTRPGACSSVALPAREPLTWQSIIASDKMKAICSWSSKSPRARFDDLFPPKYHEQSLRKDRHALLIASYGVLQIAIERGESDRCRDRALPLLTFVSMLCTHADTSPYLAHGTWQSLIGSENKAHLLWALKHYLVRTMPLIAQSPITSSLSTSGQSEAVLAAQGGVTWSRVTSPKHITADAQSTFDRRIKRATEVKDYLRLEQLWKEAIDCAQRDATFWNERLFEQFLSGYMVVRQPQRAIEVWNHMLAAGIKPKVPTYSSMIWGFGELRDGSGIEAMWSMILEAGLQPETGTHVTRIRAYSTASLWKSAIRSFDEMLRQWLDACRLHNKTLKSKDLPALGGFDKAPKPTTQALNTALLAIPKATERDEVNRLLSNSRTIGVLPDAYTYNMLLLGALKRDAHDEIDALFTQMHQQGIEPDVATFTMLINSIFRDDAFESTLTERKEAALSLLASVQAQGLEANSWTFTTMINGLIKTQDLETKNHEGIESNIEAAYSVMAYMQKEGMPLTVQIYTALVTAHFAEQPQPNIPATDAIWDQALSDKSVVLDTVFYDRLIEGYARFGQISKMKLVLAKASKNHRSPGWVALTQMLKALVKVGDWSSAENLVHNVRSEEASRTPRTRVGKAWFIETATEYAMDVQSLLPEDNWESDSSQFKEPSERVGQAL